MMKRIVLVMTCVVCILIGSCSKDDSANTPPQSGAALNSSRTAVTVGSGQTQTVIISGGTPTYTITTIPNSSLATAQLNNANRDTTTLVIIGAVSTATGTTPVVVRDNSTTTKQVSITITKQ